MKKVIERMNNSVVEEQLSRRKSGGSAAVGNSKEAKKKWPFTRKASGAGPEKPQGQGEEEEVEGMRVDFYLVVFLKFIASIVPTIEVDSTTSF
jgi:ubiquitin-like-conjugating enzyme ATG3